MAKKLKALLNFLTQKVQSLSRVQVRQPRKAFAPVYAQGKTLRTRRPSQNRRRD